MSKTSKDASPVSAGSGSERRRAPRYQLRAEAEIFESHSQVRLRARTSDVSLYGCYVNSVNWLPPGSEIQLRIMYQDANFTAGGRVVRSGSAAGVAVEFTSVPADQKAILKNWLAAAV